MLTGEPIIILDAFQTGASFLSAALSTLGASLGAGQDFHDLNLRGYSVFGLDFHQANPLPSDWREVPGNKTFMEEARVMLRNKFEGRALWALTEPAVSGLIPIYQELLSKEQLQPRYAIGVCHPISALTSEIARQNLQSSDGQVRGLEPPIGEHTLGQWLHYTLSALRDTKGLPRMVISYEDLIGDPEKNIERMAKILLPSPPSESQLKNAIASVNPESSQSRRSIEDLNSWPSLIARTYDCCLRINRDDEGFSIGEYDAEIDALWDEFGMMGKMIRPINLPSGQMILSWRQGNQPAMQAHKYSPTGNWQTLRILASPPPGSMVQIDPYQMPSQIWIRKAVWKVGGAEHRAQLSSGPNGVIEDLFGTKRLTVFGPGPLLAQVPPGAQAQEFEIEFQVQSGQTVMSNIVGILRGGIDQAKRRSAGPVPSPQMPRR